MQDLVLLAKDMLQEADAIDVWTGPEGDDGTSDLDTGQVKIPEVADRTQEAQQVVSLQITGPRSQEISQILIFKISGKFARK